MKNKATNLSKQLFRSDLGACKINELKCQTLRSSSTEREREREMLVLVLYVVTLCTLAWKNGFAECQSLNK